MMTQGSATRTRDGVLLSKTLRMIRRYRGMTAAETASAMRLSKRTYERFEAGETRLNVDYVRRFAAATRSDFYAILLAVSVGSPGLALDSADTHMPTVLVVAYRRFHAALQDRLQALPPRTVIAAVAAMFDTLTEAAEAEEQARRWLEEGVAELKVTPEPPKR